MTAKTKNQQPGKKSWRLPPARQSLSRRRLWLGLLVLLIIFNLCVPLFRNPKPVDGGEPWIVRRIVTGQILEASPALNDNGIVQRVSLIGVSTPSREQRPWGTLVRDRLKDLLLNQTVTFEFDAARKDNSDRLLVYVWLKNRLINVQLVTEGLALADPIPPNLKYADEINRAQLEARLLEAGIWDPQNPMRLTPREFRRQLN